MSVKNSPILRPASAKDRDERAKAIYDQMSTNETSKGTGLDIMANLEPVKFQDMRSTGSLKLDYALGTGGIDARGSYVHMAGRRSSGKTTLALNHVAECQTYHGDVVLYIDVEGSTVTDKDYIEDLGIDTKALLTCQPASLEDAISEVHSAIKSGVDMIVFDSVAESAPLGEVTRDSVADEGRLGTAATFWTRAIKTSNHLQLQRQQEGKRQAEMVWINQVREAINARPGQKTTYSPGGKAIEHKAWYDFQMSAGGEKGENKDLGIKRHITYVDMEKNKRGVRAVKTSYGFRPGHGIDHGIELYELLKTFKKVDLEFLGGLNFGTSLTKTNGYKAASGKMSLDLRYDDELAEAVLFDGALESDDLYVEKHHGIAFDTKDNIGLWFETHPMVYRVLRHRVLMTLPKYQMIVARSFGLDTAEEMNRLSKEAQEAKQSATVAVSDGKSTKATKPEAQEADDAADEAATKDEPAKKRTRRVVKKAAKTEVPSLESAGLAADEDGWLYQVNEGEYVLTTNSEGEEVYLSETDWQIKHEAGTLTDEFGWLLAASA